MQYVTSMHSICIPLQVHYVAQRVHYEPMHDKSKDNSTVLQAVNTGNTIEENA